MGKIKGIGVSKSRRKHSGRKRKRTTKLSKTDKWVAKTAYQNLGDLTQDIQSWADDLTRLKRNGCALEYEKLLKLLLKECRNSHNNCIRVMA